VCIQGGKRKEANPEKCRAITRMRSPKKCEGNSKADRPTCALSRFVPKLLELEALKKGGGG